MDVPEFVAVGTIRTAFLSGSVKSGENLAKIPPSMTTLDRLPEDNFASV